MPQTDTPNKNPLQDLPPKGIFHDLLAEESTQQCCSDDTYCNDNYDVNYHTDYFEKCVHSMRVKMHPDEIAEAISNKYSLEQIDIVIKNALATREKRLKTFLLAAGTLLLLVCFMLGVCRATPRFAELVCKYVSAPIRFAMGCASSVVPFSLFETVVIALPLLLGYRTVVSFFDVYDVCGKKFSFFAVKVGIAALVLISVVFCSFIPLYSAKPVNEQMGFEREKITPQQLSDACETIVENLNTLVSRGDIIFDGDGFSVMPYSFAELSEKVNLAYAKAVEKQEFSFLLDMNVPAKPLLLSKPLTYTHLSGVYTPFTGEANINTNYPDYVVAFTCAHELAHQRGVAPEDEANFMAFAVLEGSDDPYLRYCANRYLFDYMLNALWAADNESYTRILYSVCKEVLYEGAAYSVFFDTYRESAVSEVADAVNDTNLKINNQSAGSASYGMVVDLATIYINRTSENSLHRA